MWITAILTKTMPESKTLRRTSNHK